jgi:hypothetical protein
MADAATWKKRVAAWRASGQTAAEYRTQQELTLSALQRWSEARSGALFVFFGKRRDAIKVLFFDGSGIYLFYKRLDAGTFRVPEAGREGEAVVQIEERALDDLLDGIDLTSAPPARRRATH